MKPNSNQIQNYGPPSFIPFSFHLQAYITAPTPPKKTKSTMEKHQAFEDVSPTSIKDGHFPAIAMLSFSGG